jgi:uncharacterized membrane protein
MNKYTKYLLLVVVLSFAMYQLVITFLPNVIFDAFHRRMTNTVKVNDNELYYVPLPTDDTRAVVLPNPDFLYITSFYDLTEGPLSLSGSLPDSTYWSVAFYQPNTINWYVKNDLEYGTGELNLILAQNEEHTDFDKEIEIANSPVTKGLMLIRILVTDNDPAVVKKYEALQKSVKLTAIKKS